VPKSQIYGDQQSPKKVPTQATPTKHEAHTHLKDLPVQQSQDISSGDSLDIVNIKRFQSFGVKNPRNYDQAQLRQINSEKRILQ